MVYGTIGLMPGLVPTPPPDRLARRMLGWWPPMPLRNERFASYLLHKVPARAKAGTLAIWRESPRQMQDAKEVLRSNVVRPPLHPMSSVVTQRRRAG